MPTSHKQSNLNLPEQLTSFIGRDRELGEIKTLFEGARLLTLTGAAGAGKTRLALRVASQLADRFPDGAWFVDFAPVVDPGFVASTVADAVGIGESKRPALRALADYLDRKHGLLVFDNCEHVLNGCAHVTGALLRRCPNLRVLATSTEGLRVAGELVYAVPPLGLPDRARMPPIHALIQYEAVRLFVDRARFSRPGFRLTRENASTVVEVCHRLDGIPLAIELAAARIKALSIGEIAVRLGDRFRLLTGGDRAALPRHQTLRATMDWSYALLTDEERTLLRRLTVFAGSFTLNAVNGVCGQHGTDRLDVLDLMVRLVEKSLVLTEEYAQNMRYRLLETVRQYGWEHVVGAGEADDLRRRHRDWYLEVVERGAANLRGSTQQAWLVGLEAEHDNFRSSLAWCEQEPGGAEAQARMTSALWWFWYIRGHWYEARRWIDRAIERAADVPPSVLARVLCAGAFFAWRQSDYKSATAMAERGLALCREPDDRISMVWLVMALGITSLRQGDYPAAETRLANALVLAKAAGDHWLIGIMLAQQGVYARHVGDLERAISLHTEALALARALGDQHAVAYQLRNLGQDTLRDGQPREAAGHYREALEVSREFGASWLAEECLEGLAGVTGATGQHEAAATLFGAVETLRRLIGSPRSAFNQAVIDERVASTRSRLGPERFAAAWSTGESMTLAEAVEYALTSTADRTEKESAETPDAPRGPGGALAPREREIVALVAAGLSNQDIAAQLVISKRTVETHVQHVLNKLGFNSRTQIAAWAVQHGLLPGPTAGPRR